MTHLITLSDEELSEFDLMLSRHVDAMKTESRRTRSPDHGDRLRHRIALLESMLEKVALAEAGRSEIGTARG